MPRVVATLIGAAAVAALPVTAWMSDPVEPDPYAPLRRQMVDRQIRARGVDDAAVLAAMEAVPRHQFVPATLRDQAYIDRPLPIGDGQTISQPYIVALMTSLAAVGPESKVLEIGTGSGYQAAVLARLAGKVYTIEIREALAATATERLRRLGYDNVVVRAGNGYLGWPEEAPFDAIVATAAPERVPAALVEQLAVGGRLVIPVGEFFQDLQVITKTNEGVIKRDILPVRFVPMIGETEAGPVGD